MVTGLRNERKPCHFWVDNEVADCYQPIVGADAIWVYCRIARHANGAWIVSPRLRGTSDTRIGLREMAEWCGKSVDTVWRSLEVLELVGLLTAERGAKSKGRYALADVKDLVTREGAVYDRETGSFRLPDARIAELKQQVRELRLKLARKKATVKSAPSVAQSDSLGAGLFVVPEAKCDRTVTPDVQNCRSSSTDASRYISGNSKTAKQTTTPQPPQAGACDHPSDEDLSPGTPDDLDLPEEAFDASQTKSCPASVEANCVSNREDVSPDAAKAPGVAPASHCEHGGALDQRAPDRGDGYRGVGRAIDEVRNADEIPFTEEQIAHLAKHAGDAEWVAEWESYYRVLNLADAQREAVAAAAERAEVERMERLKAELIDVPVARAWVMRQCRFPGVKGRRNSALERAIEAVLTQELDLGKPLWETAPEMAAARKKFVANGEFIGVHWGPVNFFGMGIWADERGWGWNEAKLERLAGASVGSAR